MIRLSIRFSWTFVFWRASGLSAQFFIFFHFLFNYYFLAVYQESCFWICQHSDFWKAKLNLWLTPVKSSLDSAHVPFLAISFTALMFVFSVKLLQELCWVHAWLCKCRRTDGWTPPVQSWLQASTAAGVWQDILQTCANTAWQQAGTREMQHIPLWHRSARRIRVWAAMGGCSDLMPLPLLLL